MDALYWLIFIISAAVIGIYAYYWYNRPSGMSEVQKVSYSYDALEYIDFYVRLQGESSEKYGIRKQEHVSYMKKREQAWRQRDFIAYYKRRVQAWRERNDIIAYMHGMNWIYEVEKDGVEYYVISEPGRRELKTSFGLRGAVEEAALKLHERKISSSQAKVAVADILAAALRVDSRTAPESYQRADAKREAEDLEEAVKTGDPSKIDRRIDRVKNLLQIATSAYNFATEILHILRL
jgi:hypothetical protein